MSASALGGVASAAVAHSWSAHFQDLLKSMNVHVPPVLAKTPMIYHEKLHHYVLSGSFFDLIALVITFIITAILASLGPARKALKLNPAEAVRHEA